MIINYVLLTISGSINSFVKIRWQLCLCTPNQTNEKMISPDVQGNGD